MKVIQEPDAALDQLARDVIGAAIEVHRCLGPGLLEEAYERALCIELADRTIPFARQVEVSVAYKGQTASRGIIDILVREQLILELKAVESLAAVHTAQALAYLRMTGYRLVLLMNFNVPVLKQGIRRVVL